jgi:YgiT-type zinc finger domain-containing protein
MKCVICKQGVTLPGKTTITLERDGMTLVVKGVPAQVCQNCGEEYVSEQVTEDLLVRAEQLAQSGTQVDIRQYIAVHG